MVASPDKALVTQEEPSAMSRLPEVAVVVPKVAPLILATVREGEMVVVPLAEPETSPLAVQVILWFPVM